MMPAVPNYVGNKFADLTQTLFGDDMDKIQATVDTMSAKLGVQPTARATAKLPAEYTAQTPVQGRRAPFVTPKKNTPVQQVNWDEFVYYTDKKNPDEWVCPSTASNKCRDLH